MLHNVGQLPMLRGEDELPMLCSEGHLAMSCSEGHLAMLCCVLTACLIANKKATYKSQKPVCLSIEIYT